MDVLSTSVNSVSPRVPPPKRLHSEDRCRPFIGRSTHPDVEETTVREHGERVVNMFH